ncbi:hypothetical protein PIB30_096483, partial [Stylosanthes scabra]|nr:hypothetical protein [Stylosanthes scabra]
QQPWDMVEQSSYDAPSSYHSQSYGSHSAPPPTMDEARQTTTADPLQPSPTGRPRRETRPPTCGTGGHIRAPRGRH